MQTKWAGVVGMRTLLQNMSEKIKDIQTAIIKKIIFFFSTFTRYSTHCILQADKSLEPLPIILFDISHLQNYTVQN